jgi:hypothetical protein
MTAPVETPKKSGGTYQKVKTAPFTEGGQLLNAVYIARPKDSFKSVAKMIYGDDKKNKDLKKANPGLSSLKTGDKVYYNSPQRPTDDQKMASYYEDSGMMPETYVTKEGDDLKKVSKNLMGFDNAWKEVYALNTVESKTELPAGTELKYWKPAPATVDLAANSSMPSTNEMPPSNMGEMPPPPPVAELPPPPPIAELPPPPPVQAVAPPAPPVAELPPPPPPEPVAPPPPPPPVAKKTVPKEAPVEGGMDNDMVMALGGGGILLVGLVAIMVLRKRKQAKEMAAAFNETQVGT